MRPPTRIPGCRTCLSRPGAAWCGSVEWHVNGTGEADGCRRFRGGCCRLLLGRDPLVTLDHRQGCVLDCQRIRRRAGQHGGDGVSVPAVELLARARGRISVGRIGAYPFAGACYALVERDLSAWPE